MIDNDEILKVKKPFSLRGWLFGLSYDRKIFLLGLLIAFCGAVFWLIYPYYVEFTHFDECAFRHATGFYCPGCGGIRAVRALLNGHIIFSFLYNPFVTYSVIMWVIYSISHLLEILKVPNIRGMKFRTGYVYIGLGLLFANWIIKNISILIVHYL